jgi:hypothetical protein
MTDETAHVDRRSGRNYALEEWLDWNFPTSIRVRDDSRHTLTDIVLRQWNADDALARVLRMGVDINEPRRQNQPPRVNRPGVRRVKLSRDGNNGVAFDPDISDKPWIAGTVDDTASPYDDVEARGLSRDRQEAEGKKNRGRNCDAP